MNHQPAIPVAYADLPARWGVTSNWEPDRFQIIVPPIPSWRHLHPAYWLGCIPAGFALVLLVLRIVQGPAAGLYPPMLFYLAVSFAVFLQALSRLFARTIITVTRDALVITRATPWTRPLVTRWRRDEIGDIKMNPHTQKMLLRITGKDLPEYFISANQEVTALVVEAVRAAFYDGTFEPSKNEVFAVVKPLRARMSFKPVIWISMALVLAGLILLVASISVPGGILLGVGLLLATYAAGITYGTQEKTFLCD